MNQYHLIDLLREPGLMKYCGHEDWNRILGHARQNKLLARLAFLADEQGHLKQLPEKVQTHFHAARLYAENHQRVVRWELYRLQQVWREYQGPLLLLKGAAYQIAALPPARGRLISDVDLMCQRSDIVKLETQLLDAGWVHSKLHPYDQRYYRQWMHEIPPMKHWRRQLEIDLHHHILPLTSRLKPQAWRLIEAAIPVAGHAPWKVLCPSDMFLHSAAHFFQDGDFTSGIRDLTDMDDLLRHFHQQEPEFWDQLLTRAELLDLRRPCFYALRYTHQFFQAPIPNAAMESIRHWGPDQVTLRCMDHLVHRALLPEDHRQSQWKQWDTQLSSALLYARSHWLRMPPFLLARHLSIKSWRSLFPEANET